MDEVLRKLFRNRRMMIVYVGTVVISGIFSQLSVRLRKKKVCLWVGCGFRINKTYEAIMYANRTELSTTAIP